MPEEHNAQRPPEDAQRPIPRPPSDNRMPDYKGEPLDPARGPGLGCFWLQVGLLVLLLVLTPLSVVMGAAPWISAALLILVLLLLFFVGQTAIFLLRLVAADRRTRRRPLGGAARKTVGQIEEEQAPDRTADEDPGSTGQ